MAQKPMEERGENGRTHVIKKRWTKHPENPRRGCIEKYNETAGRHDNDQRKSCKIFGKWRKPERMLGTNRDDAVRANAKNKPCKIRWKMEETGANARNKP